MAEMPERIWAANGWTRRWSHEPMADDSGAQFVRADLADAQAAEIERLRDALRGLLLCPAIADEIPPWKDEETDAAERRARAALGEG